jgi:hypothetical protein
MKWIIGLSPDPTYVITHKFLRSMLQMSSNSLISHDLEFTHNSPVEIRKPSSLGKPDAPEREPKETTMTVLNLIEGAWTD